MAKPWEGLENVEVVEQAPAQTQPTESAAPSSAGKPWDGISNVEVLPASPEDMAYGTAERVTETYLDDQEVGRTLADPANPTLTWAEQVGRSATLDLGDYAAAGLAYWNLKKQHPDLTYRQTLGMVRGILEGEQSLSADVVGALLPGAGVAKGGKFVMGAASRAGVVNGAMKWVAKNPKKAWLAVTPATGAIAGAVEEGMRASVEETIDAATGRGFNGEDVTDAMISGSIIGAISAPIGQGAVAGARGFVQWLGSQVGLSGPQLQQAGAYVARALGREGEAPEEVAERLAADAAEFETKNGRKANLLDIATPEQAEDAVNIIRSHKGLDTTARKYADDMVERESVALREAGESGARLKAPLELEAQAGELFNTLSRRFGNTPVQVTDEAIDVLSRNSGWLARQSGASARAVQRVVSAKSNISDMRTKARRLQQRAKVAGSGEEVAGLRLQLAQMIDDLRQGAPVPASEATQLQHLIDLQSALARYESAAIRAGETEIDSTAFRNMLGEAERVLDEFERDGLKIPFRDANQMRSNAARHAHGAYKRGDVLEGDVLSEVSRGLMTVGTDEVPKAPLVRRMYSYAMTRAEAQAVGEAAVRGTKTPENLRVMAQRGIRPGNTNVGRGQMPAHREGASEGVGVELREVSRASPAEMRAGAKKIAEDKGVQMSLEGVAPDRAKRVIDTATQSEKSLGAAETLRKPKSRSSVKDEDDEMKELVAAGFLSGSGGAARAGFVSRILMRFGISRGAAKKVVEMLADPEMQDQALKYMRRHKVDVRALLGAWSAGSAAAMVEEDRE